MQKHPPRARNNNRQLNTAFFKLVEDGHDCRLCIQSVKYGLDHDQINPTVEQAFQSLVVTISELIKIDVAITRIVNIR